MPAVVPLVAAGIGAGGAALSARSQSNAAKAAANAAQQSNDASIAEQRRQYDLSRGDNAPWLQTGQSALGQLASLYGLAGGTQSAFDERGYLAANPDVAASIRQGGFGGSALNHYNEYGKAENRQGAMTPTGMDAFVASPDYQFRQDEQARALTARNSSLGIQDSGAAQKAALKYSGNLASGEFNNYANRLASLAGVGQTAASQNQALGTNYANAITGINNNTGQALASSYQQQGAINGGLAQNLAGIGSSLVTNLWGQRR